MHLIHYYLLKEARLNDNYLKEKVLGRNILEETYFLLPVFCWSSSVLLEPASCVK